MSTSKLYLATACDYLRLAIPIMLSSISIVIISWGDNIIVGRVSEVARAGVATSSATFFVCLIFLYGISSNLLALISGHAAHDEYEQASYKLLKVVLVNLCFATLLFLLLQYFATHIDVLNQGDKVNAIATPFLRILACSIFPYAFVVPVRRYLDAIGWVWLNMGYAILAGVVNISLNYVLVYGKFSFPTLGVMGAAWATLATRLMMASIYIGYIFYLKHKGLLVAVSPRGIQRRELVTLLKLGVPSGLGMSLSVGYVYVTLTMLGWIGTNARASASILTDFERLSLMLPVALSAAASILVSRAVSRRDRSRLLRLVRVGYGLGVILILAMGLLFFLTHPLLLDALYRPKPVVYAQVCLFIYFLILMQLGNGLKVISSGILRGMRDTLTPFLLETAICWSVGGPISYFVGFYYLGGEAYGVWLGLIVGLVAAGTALTLRVCYNVRGYLSTWPVKA